MIIGTRKARALTGPPPAADPADRTDPSRTELWSADLTPADPSRTDTSTTDLQGRLAALTGAVPHGTAVVAAAISGPEQALFCHGSTGHGPGVRAVGPDTRFEIGSLTKTFTALLLADMAARGEVRLDDPITAHLPPGAAPRHPSARRITLLHLATHTSGLPRLPANLYPVALPRWGTNPYAGYSPEQLLRAIAHARPRSRPGRRVHYSNFGVGLLGRLLAEAAGDTYEHLIADRVCAPLGMTATATAAAPAADRATGHRRRGEPVPTWRIPGLPGAGCLASSAADLLRYLDAHLHPDRAPTTAAASSLAAALHDVRRPRLAVPRTGDRLCLVWNLRSFPGRGPRPGYDLLFHSGGTCGFTAFAGFSPQAGVALAAVAGTAPSLRGTFVQAAYRRLGSLVRERTA
ncbi:serine hydrolase domain-containing protein [Streptomyces sp. 7N604]|uniref:serine hydrolase domain-containing protein n=1 Tax=Streptomyces sp. 7N604 TaxID=3457415 RepID=UPI003FD2F00C